MADKTIGDYTAAVSIDASNDYYLIEQSGVYKKINRNVGLGLSSAPLGLTDSQSPQNKAFDNTNTLTIKTSNLTLQSSSDVTKQAIFSAASITAGQTRTFTFPDASGTLVTAAGSQTLTSKTITSPTISGGSIDNSTITVDSISGHTLGTLVTIANLQISNGVLNSANAVTATSIAAGAIQPQALVSGTGSGWSYQSYTPTWSASSSPAIGNGTLTGRYIQVGKTVNGYINLAAGSTTTFGSGLWAFTLPITASSNMSTNITIGTAAVTDTGVQQYMGLVFMATTTTVSLYYSDTSGAGRATGVGSTTPFTFGNGDTVRLTFSYEAA